MRDSSGKGSILDKICFFRSDSATSTIIGAVLLLGIIFTVFSVIRIGYVPEWKTDAEYSHMDDVWEDMADLKSKIDMMSIILASTPNSSYINSSSPDSSAPQLVMSVPFDMGGGEIPLVGSTKSSGTLTVNKDKCIINMILHNETSDYSFDISCGTIIYNSQNNYYVNQAFSYEGGGLIFDQGEQSSMMLSPSIRFSRTPTNEYNVSINAVRIFQKPYIPAQVISSNTKCSVRLIGLDYRSLYDNSNTIGNIDRFELTVYTKHTGAWEQYLKKAIEEADIDPGEYDIVLGESNSVHLTFPSESSEIGLKRLYVSETVVKAEPGIGLR